MAILSDQIVKFLNFRIEQEELASRLYLAMSNWLSDKGFVGAAKLWTAYSIEETEHAQWSYKYLLDLGYQPVTPALTAVPNDFQSLVDIIKKSYDHEVLITNQCKELMKACLAEGDYLTMQLANIFLTEQIDEIEKTQYWIDRINAFGSDKAALRFLDNEMSTYEN